MISRFYTVVVHRTSLQCHRFLVGLSSSFASMFSRHCRLHLRPNGELQSFHRRRHGTVHSQRRAIPRHSATRPMEPALIQTTQERQACRIQQCYTTSASRAFPLTVVCCG